MRGRMQADQHICYFVRAFMGEAVSASVDT